LEAVLWWLNYRLKKRERFFEEVLALVNWRLIKGNQFRFLLASKIVQKSEKLKQLLKHISE